MKLPKRTQQQKSESDSFAIILYKLKELGIFRNMTENDFGIDFEIEIVKDNMVEGHCIKVQVKSKISNLLRKDDHATIGGIKLSTLYYWAELSYNTPVIALAVNLESKNEDIYVSDPLFWQAIRLIDESLSSNNRKDKDTYPTKTLDLGILRDIKFNISKLRKIADNVDLREFLYAHKWILHNFNKICDMLEDADGCDRFMTCSEPLLFENMLEYLTIMFNYTTVFSSALPSPNLPSYQKCKRQSNGDEPYNDIVCRVFKDYCTSILSILKEFRQKVLDSAAYWLSKDIRYLKLVYCTYIPNCNDFEEFLHYCQNQQERDDNLYDKFTTFALDKINQTGLEYIDICSIFND